jgi:Pyruvate/2-oxoacid:ferredoxin oxidoreductase delta subunit
MARELTYEELAAHLEELNKNGLVHTLNIQNSICNCCNDCCAIALSEECGPKAFAPSPFIPRIDEETCNACDKCAEQCPTKAIAVEEFGDSVSVDVEYDKCIGCGVCITACNKNCMWLERRPVAA